MNTRVAIVEDNAELRRSLSEVISASAGLEITAAYKSAEDALLWIPKQKADVVIMDIRLPEMTGIECTARLRRISPEVFVLILTAFEDSDQIFEALQAGASGYLLKRATPEEIVDAVRQVKAGGAPMTPEIARRVVASFHRPPKKREQTEALTGREEEILELLSKGYVPKEIADQLKISVETVRTHLRHIYEKLHVRSRTEAVIKYLG
jgi:DNA-binding NarL/FixJ family response regulator